MPLGVLILSLLKWSQVALDSQPSPEGYPFPLLLLPRERGIHDMILPVRRWTHKNGTLSYRVGLPFLWVDGNGLGYIKRSFARCKINEWILVDGRFVERVSLVIALTDELWLHPYGVVFAWPRLNHHALSVPLLELGLSSRWLCKTANCYGFDIIKFWLCISHVSPCMNSELLLRRAIVEKVIECLPFLLFLMQSYCLFYFSSCLFHINCSSIDCIQENTIHSHPFCKLPLVIPVFSRRHVLFTAK